ncbi:thiamine biosynthesis protein MoeB [Salibacterium salarium]|uniref:Thiamine biosynthesis protein MoeB n=1 Tax=Salibacterium salarium TaxID=284579 RepID=A0A428N551_9BACI|nr:ThiF family adenylyltransferase [Salibacterium salarium]RSL33625.1 thiamine biosynthesis protein MoeB [Salibacterium salarium]
MESRYARQELFSPIGKEGQHQLQNKHVLIMGAGALGSANAETLVRAGVGKITIIDRDVVEMSNLHRQQLYTENDAAEDMPKAIAAKERLQQINQDTEINAFVLDADAANLEKLVKDVDLIIDGTDNFEIRFILNDLSQKYDVPWIFGASAGSFGMTCPFIPGESPCLQCLFQRIPQMSMSCDTSGVIGPAIQMTASYQAAEALKLLTKNQASLRKKLLFFDVWNGQHQSMGINNAKNKECLSCGTDRTYPSLTKQENTHVDVLCGRDTIQIRPAAGIEYDFSQLANQLQFHGEVKRNKYVLTFLFHQYRLAVFQDGRVLIHGTKKVEEATSIYYQFFAANDTNLVTKEEKIW